MIATVAPAAAAQSRVPSPDTAMPCGLPVPLDTTLTVPPRGPTSVGRNVTSMVQVPPIATLPAQVVAATRNSVLVDVTLVTLTAAVPVLVAVTRLAALVCRAPGRRTATTTSRARACRRSPAGASPTLKVAGCRRRWTPAWLVRRSRSGLATHCPPSSTFPSARPGSCRRLALRERVRVVGWGPVAPRRSCSGTGSCRIARTRAAAQAAAARARASDERRSVSLRRLREIPAITAEPRPRAAPAVPEPKRSIATTIPMSYPDVMDADERSLPGDESQPGSSGRPIRDLGRSLRTPWPRRLDRGTGLWHANRPGPPLIPCRGRAAGHAGDWSPRPLWARLERTRRFEPACGRGGRQYGPEQMRLKRSGDSPTRLAPRRSGFLLPRPLPTVRGTDQPSRRPLPRGP